MLQVGFGLLALMAAASLFLTALPVLGAALGAVMVLSGSAWRLRRVRRQETVQLRVADNGAWAVLLQANQRPHLYPSARVVLRGPLATLSVRDAAGHWQAWTWWPDTCGADARRRLRLAGAGAKAHSGPGLATMQG